MSKITHIDKSNARDVADIIRDKLSELKDENGLTITFEGNMTLQADGSGMTSKINIKPDINKEDIEAQAKADWALYAPRFELPVDGYGTVLIINNKKYTAAGIKPNRPKNSLVIRDAKTGETRICPPSLFHTCKAA